MSKNRAKIPSYKRILPTTKVKKREYLPRTNHWFTTSRAKQTTKDASFWSKTNSVLKKSCTFAPVFERDKWLGPAGQNNGLLAQLVQSASFTRKRSTVRICNRPLFFALGIQCFFFEKNCNSINFFCKFAMLPVSQPTALNHWKPDNKKRNTPQF